MGNDEVLPPVVCTLTITKRAERQLEWGDLAALAVSQHKIEGGALSTYPLDMADAIEDLANRELSCCGSWLNIEHKLESDHVALTITTSNPEGVELIRSFGRG